MNHKYPDYVGGMNNKGEPTTIVGEYNVTLSHSEQSGHKLICSTDNFDFSTSVEFLNTRPVDLDELEHLSRDMKLVLHIDSAEVQSMLDWARVAMSYHSDE